MHRHPKALISQRELAALYQLSFDSGTSLTDGHRQLLLSMKLIELKAGELRLTAEGRERLGREKPDRPPANRPGLPI